MLNPKFMAPMQEQESRNKAFYLIKKYTSYTFLDQIRVLYQQFLDAFERQLRNPPKKVLQHQFSDHLQKRHEGEYIHFLEKMVQLEQGLNLLKTTKYKKEAYITFLGPDISDRMFDRYADENGIVDDPFYILLGLGYSKSTDLFMPIDPRMYSVSTKVDHSNYVNLVLIALSLRSLCIRSLASVKTDRDPFAYLDKETTRASIKWSYETIFFSKEWPPLRVYPEPIPMCPPFNLDSKEEIATGEEVYITGIYEPWLPINGKVGCPNYFLEGTTATQYQLDGTDDWYDVKWRLIWEDNRYIDGTIPEEEKNYIFDIENIGKHANQPETESNEKLSMAAGQVCPKAGYWYTTAKSNSRQYFKQGEIFPNYESDWGETIWYLEVTNKK
ncbi:Imm72 family immunity protein [Acinetobacter indicus]|uniref:Imm72 family immunity protein n=1 Tax=Acinetobacter indicus TaxID=756892 RepID=UPI0009491BA1|nr:Imm72 family immunity protein [Acinetobacter indicus]